MLDVCQLSKSYRRRQGDLPVLRSVSLSLDRGDFTAVHGPSGCGKTTLLLTAGALLAPEGGSVRIDGHDPYAMNAGDRARLRAGTVGFVFQQFHLVPYLTVLENVMTPSLAQPAPAASTRARELIERFALADRADHVPADLSTGERQRTALARALLNRPGLLLADEPTGNLDDGNARVVLDSLTEFAANGGAVLLVTHDMNVARHTQRTCRLENGRLCQT